MKAYKPTNPGINKFGAPSSGGFNGNTSQRIGRFLVVLLEVLGGENFLS